MAFKNYKFLRKLLKTQKLPYTATLISLSFLQTILPKPEFSSKFVFTGKYDNCWEHSMPAQACVASFFETE